MKYQAWIVARDRKTLQVLANVLAYEHEDRLNVEEYIMSLKPAAVANYMFGAAVTGQDPLYSTETRIPGWGPVAGGAGGAGGGAGGAGGGGGSGFTVMPCKNCGVYMSNRNTRCANCGRPM